MVAPKLFISYSWSSPEHVAWVIGLATELRSQGIDVKLDQWDLKPGHDANVFMESMVTDPDIKKVALIFDRVYAEKSDLRTGGVGTEAQIVTPELYKKSDQNKFAAVVREVNAEGHPYKPTYYGNRIHIDLSNESNYAEELEKLVRWVYDKPSLVKPELGVTPSYLADDGTQAQSVTDFDFRRAVEAIKNGRTYTAQAVQDFFDKVISLLPEHRIQVRKQQDFQLVLNSLDRFTTVFHQILRIVDLSTKQRPSESFKGSFHDFLEKVLSFTRRDKDMNSWSDDDFDNFKFMSYEIFLYSVAISIRNQQYEYAADLIEGLYFIGRDDANSPMRDFVIFNSYPSSLNNRNANRTSARADLLKERNGATGIDYSLLMTVDIILFLRSQLSDSFFQWWPDTLVYRSRYGEVLPVFARAKSRKHCANVLHLLGFKEKSEIEELVSTLESSKRVPKFGYEPFNLRELIRLDEMCTSP